MYSYNTAVTNVNTTVIHNTYNTTVINNNTTVNHVSYNGGTGGTTAQPTAAEQAAAHEQHTPPTALQTQHEHTASTNHALLASANHGQPSVAATAKPGVFSGSGVVAARPASVSANANRTSTHNDRPPNASTNKGASSPTTAKTYSAQPNQQQHGSSQPQHGSNRPPSNAPHPNEAHPNNSHQNNNRPGTPHHSEGHPTGRLGRGR